MADWTEAYRPKTLDAVRGNDKAVKELREWAETWNDHGEAVILHGPPGIGKTSAAHALAADMGWESTELNASDERKADDIDRVAGRAAKNSTLEGAFEKAVRSSTNNDARSGSESAEDETGRQLIILDEADNIHHQKDWGGQQALVEIIETATQPIVMIANDVYDMSRGLSAAGRQIQFRALKSHEILSVLRNLCREEGIQFTDEALDLLTEHGDLRGAINDLQVAAQGTDRVTIEEIETASRDREQTIWTFLDAVLKDADARSALHTAYDVDETPDSLVQWVEDKAPMVYDGDELARAYEFLANGDRWLGRVRATQDYSYWRYVTDNMAAGVAAARTRERDGFTRYGGPPFRSRSNARRDHVARAIAETSGTSMATARRWVLPFLAAMTHHCRQRELTVAMAAAFDLDAEHVAFVTGSGKNTNKVQSIVADAKERRAVEAVEHSDGAFEGTPSDDLGLSAFAADEDDAAEADADEAGRAADPAVAADDESQSGLSDFT